jgi:hypothetical protein
MYDAQQVIPPDPRQRAFHHRCMISLVLSLIVARAGEFQRYAASHVIAGCEKLG